MVQPLPPFDGEALAQAAIRLCGTPFRHYGDDPARGVDCLGLILAAYRALGWPVASPRGYALRYNTVPDWPHLTKALGLSPLPTQSPIHRGDILMLRPAVCQVHLGIAASPRTWVHAHGGLRKVVLGPIPDVWPRLRHWRLVSR